MHSGVVRTHAGTRWCWRYHGDGNLFLFLSLSLTHTMIENVASLKLRAEMRRKSTTFFFFSPLNEKRRHEKYPSTMLSRQCLTPLMIACCVPVDVFSSASRSTSCSRDDGTKRDETERNRTGFPLCIGTAEINSRREDNRKWKHKMWSVECRPLEKKRRNKQQLLCHSFKIAHVFFLLFLLFCYLLMHLEEEKRGKLLIRNTA